MLFGHEMMKLFSKYSNLCEKHNLNITDDWQTNRRTDRRLTVA